MVPEPEQPSRGLPLVVIEQSAKPFASKDPALSCTQTRAGLDDFVAQAPVIALSVVVLHVLADDGPQMSLAKQNHVIERS